MSASAASHVELPDVVRVLRDDGSLDSKKDPKIAPDEIVRAYGSMVRARLIDERLVELQREGRIGFHNGALGEEAAIVGAVAAMRERDWVFPSYREIGAALHRGTPLQTYIHHMFGDALDPVKGRQMPDHFTARSIRFGSVSSSLGTQITHGVGFAWAAKTRKEDLATLIYFGEGATASGEFHNGVNFAGVFKTPTVFLCRNSDWALEDGSQESMAAKAIAYGVPSVRCDGNDLFAVMKVTRDALARAKKGEGATLIEALTFRIPPASDGPPSRHDPITRVRAYLERARVAEWSQTKQDELEAETKRAIEEAIAIAEASPSPSIDTLFTDVYGDVPPHLREQLESLRGLDAK